MKLEIKKENSGIEELCRGTIMIFAMPVGTAKWAERYR